MLGPHTPMERAARDQISRNFKPLRRRRARVKRPGIRIFLREARVVSEAREVSEAAMHTRRSTGFMFEDNAGPVK